MAAIGGTSACPSLPSWAAARPAEAAKARSPATNRETDDGLPIRASRFLLRPGLSLNESVRGPPFPSVIRLNHSFQKFEKAPRKLLRRVKTNAHQFALALA